MLQKDKINVHIENTMICDDVLTANMVSSLQLCNDNYRRYNNLIAR